MALWDPPNVVGDAEVIGRRLFQRKSLIGANDQAAQPNGYVINDFMETRGAGEVSLDRLGPSGVKNDVIR
jgi:hypothetical protein